MYGGSGGGLTTKVLRFLGPETTVPQFSTMLILEGQSEVGSSIMPVFRSSLTPFEAAPLDSLRALLAHEVFPRGNKSKQGVRMYRVKKVGPEPRKTGLGCSGYTHLFRKPRGRWVNLLKQSSSETRTGEAGPQRAYAA